MKLSSKLLVMAALGTVAMPSLHAAVSSFSFQEIGAESVYADNTGTTLAPNGSLVLLVADTSGNGSGFGSITGGQNIDVGSIIAGHDLVVDQEGLSADGLLFASPSLTTFSNWVSGDPLAIYWIPSLTPGATTVAGSVDYGLYTSSVVSGGSAAWITPNDGDSYPPIYFSTNNGDLGPSNAPSDAGFASMMTTPIPEPSVYALLGGLTAMGVALRKRKQTA